MRLRPRREQVTRALAWGVHLYTALGLVAAAGMAVLIVRGGHPAFHGAFVLMFVATLIDATDGTLARRIRIREILPGFDGRKLDDLTDFLNYTVLPLLADLACRNPARRAGMVARSFPCWPVPTASARLRPRPTTATSWVSPRSGTWWRSTSMCSGWTAGWRSGWFWSLSLLTFVPSRHLYPSQPGRLNRWALILGAFWGCSLVWVLWRMPFHPPTAGRIPSDSLRSVALISLGYPAYYMFASWGLSLRLWLRARS